MNWPQFLSVLVGAAVAVGGAWSPSPDALLSLGSLIIGGALGNAFPIKSNLKKEP